MIKLIAFDIDGTLAEINKPILPSSVDILRQLEESGIRLVFISGKPAIYICGMLRQIGLKRPIIIGENGATIFYGNGIPPEKIVSIDVSDAQSNLLNRFKRRLAHEFGDGIWFQPNLVNVTCFFVNLEMKKQVEDFVKVLTNHPEYSGLIKAYIHSDSVDLVPCNLNKGEALKKVLLEEKLNSKDVIAVGDGENDYLMFDAAGLSIGININKRYKVSIEFENITKALDYILINRLNMQEGLK